MWLEKKNIEKKTYAVSKDILFTQWNIDKFHWHCVIDFVSVSLLKVPIKEQLSFV